MPIVISPKIEEKLLQKHRVTRDEVEQCFANRDGKLLFDTREEHNSDPKTMWFLAETNYGRLLKVAFIPGVEDVFIRSAFEPNELEIRIYKNHAY